MVPEELVGGFCASLQAAYANLSQQARKLETERERFHQAHRYVNHWNAQQNEVVFIDVGGTRFHTTHSTITRHKDSMLSVLFSKRMQDNDFIFVDDDYVFIDRDPKFFQLVLQYLRYGTGGCYAPEEKECMNALLADASYYGLEGLRQQLEKRIWEQKRQEMEHLQRSLHRERAEREEEKQRHLIQEQILQEQLRQTLKAKEAIPEEAPWSNDPYSEDVDSWNYEEDDGFLMAPIQPPTAPPLAPAKQPLHLPKTPTSSAIPVTARLPEPDSRASTEFEHRFKEQLKRTQELERVVQMSLVATPKQNNRAPFGKPVGMTASPRASPLQVRSASPFRESFLAVDNQYRGTLPGQPRPASSLAEPRIQAASPRRMPTAHHTARLSSEPKEFLGDTFQMHSPPRSSPPQRQHLEYAPRQRVETLEVARWQRHFA